MPGEAWQGGIDRVDVDPVIDAIFQRMVETQGDDPFRVIGGVFNVPTYAAHGLYPMRRLASSSSKIRCL